MRYGGPIDADVIFIAELEELLPGELHAIVHDNGVRYSKAMDDIKEDNMACSDLIMQINQASIHFVNLSTVTSKRA